MFKKKKRSHMSNFEENLNFEKIKKTEVFDSGLSIVEPKILIPTKINTIVKSIQKKVGSEEFSVLLKGRWTERGYEIENTFYIPEQKVTGTSVDYIENLSELQKQGWNVVYHSHPFSETPSFSESDKTSINCHFDCSLLGNRDGIKVGILSFFTGDFIIQVNAEVVFIEEAIEVDISKIRKKVIPPYYNGYYDFYKWEK